MNNQNDSEVESLLLNSCWNQSGTDPYLLEGHKLLLENELDSLPSDSESVKNSGIDVFETLLNASAISTSNANLAELKPLPPFTGFSSHLSINGISGHHYHAIAQRLPEENNNNYTTSSYHNPSSITSGENNIVSSSTCLPDSVLMEADTPMNDVKLFSEVSTESKTYLSNNCVIETNAADSVSSAKMFADSKELEEYDMSSIDDIAAIIGSAIADTTVPNKVENEDTDTRDSWMDLDAWIGGASGSPDKLIVSNHESISDYLLPHSPILNTPGSTLQSLLTHGYMPLLQNRLTNSHSHVTSVKVEAPSSTSYCGELTSSTSTSPPGSVCSTTTENVLLNSRFIQQTSHYLNSIKSEGICSSDVLVAYPHTTSSSSTSSKKQRQRSQKKHMAQSPVPSSAMAQSFPSASDLNGLLSKEKPVHRCNICNRGFLNKSNIKVHLRTHTGEKPFRCEVCSKAFRQKAHLIKHQQIHKRIGRD